MKKVLTILLGMVLVFSMVCGVGADTTITASGTQNAVTTVTYSVADSYSVTIPSTITINANDGTGNDDIDVIIYRIGPSKLLNVTISADDGYYDGDESVWIMKHTSQDDDAFIPYLVGKGAEHIGSGVTTSPVKPGDVVLSVPSDVKSTQSVKIHCKIPGYDEAGFSGSYEGKLKFTVSIA